MKTITATLLFGLLLLAGCSGAGQFPAAPPYHADAGGGGAGGGGY